VRKFTVIDAEQRSPEWFAARIGRLTGSRAADMLATIKSGEAAARRDLRLQGVCERLTGRSCDSDYTNADMQRGTDLEPAAFAAYEATTGHLVQRTGFLAHSEHLAGCSLDGHVGDFEGLIELKCPRSATHLRYLRAGVVPPDHRPQMVHNLWVTGAQWCDFVSYDDRFPAELQVFIVRLERDEAEIAAYERKALTFLEEVAREVEAVRTMMHVGHVMREVVQSA